MTRIDKLTPEQEAMLPGIQAEWIGYGLSTEPANRAQAEAGVIAAYEVANLKPPTHVIWLDSPMAGAVAAAVLAKFDEKAPGSIFPNLHDPDLKKQVTDQEIRAQLHHAVYGQHDAGWLSFYAAFLKLGLECCEKLSGVMTVAQNSGWWWPFEDAVILTERPVLLERDNQGRLHAENGPALRYPDGFSLFSWHGTRVPASLVEGEGWTTEQILQESNTEIRRCAIEKVGWDKFVNEGALTLVASCPDPGNPGYDISLYDLPENLADMYEESARLFLCTNGTVERDGTRRRFGLVVPAHHTNPVAAAADMYDIPADEYKQLEVRR